MSSALHNGSATSCTNIFPGSRLATVEELSSVRFTKKKLLRSRSTWREQSFTASAAVWVAALKTSPGWWVNRGGALAVRTAQQECAVHDSKQSCKRGRFLSDERRNETRYFVLITANYTERC